MNCCKIISIIIAVFVAISIIAIGTSGIRGYFAAVEDTCIKTACNDIDIFYEGENITIAHVFFQLNKNKEDGSIFQKNGEYYNKTSTCESIPVTIKCYYYVEECYRRFCVPIYKLLPVRQLTPLWAFFFLVLGIPIAILVFSLEWYNWRCNGNYCGCCSSSVIKAIVLSITITCTLTALAIGILGGIGFIDNQNKECYKVNCSKEQSALNGQIINVIKVTMELTLINSDWLIDKPQYTYLDINKNNCEQVDRIISCYYSLAENSISNIRIHNFMFFMMFVPILAGIVASFFSGTMIR